jgi:uncharacterized peroxidase-related enzyme
VNRSPEAPGPANSERAERRVVQVTHGKREGRHRKSHPIHTVETAPDGAKDILSGAARAYGFIPNLLGTMAAAPALLKAYTSLTRIFDESSLSATERHVVLLTVSTENTCHYCVAAHSVIAAMQKVPGDVVEAIRTGAPIADARLEALRRFTAAVVVSRGRPSGADTERFLSVGYGWQQVLEVVLGVGIKTMANYTNHMAGTPLDNAFAGAEWVSVTSAGPQEP